MKQRKDAQIAMAYSKNLATFLLMGFLHVSAATQRGVREQPVMTVTEMIAYWGYPVEEHQVTTDDGYILTMHRIPHGRDSNETNVGRPPVFFGPCLTCTSGVFSFGPPDNSLAYMIADAGYDVWLGNTRGTTWSRGHVSLSPDDPEFWAFDWDTTATTDYPAEVDYVLEATGADDLFIVGYSMGSTEYFAFLSDRDEYNSKVRAGFTMAPAVFMGNAFNPVFVLSPYVDQMLEWLHKDLGIYEFFPHRDIYSFVGHHFCDEEHPESQSVCADVMSVMMPRDLIDPDMIPFYLDHLPGGSTAEMWAHYAQLHLNPGRFAKYDFGEEGNLEHYGQAEPPEYDLTRVEAATVLFAGDSDGLAAVTDVDLLADVLPNLLDYRIVDYSGWTHLCFGAAVNAGELVYTEIIAYMDQLS